jgi:homoserine kinase type II
MSVFTEVGRDQLVEFLRQYSVGQLLDYRGIAAGIENTNYFVDTDKQQLVLTLFEHQQESELEYCLGLMGALAEAGIPTAGPVAGIDHKTLRHLAGKPAALVTRLNGKSVEQPTTEHCHALGSMLADFHRVGQNYPPTQSNPRGEEWFQAIAEEVMPKVSADQEQLLRTELNLQVVVDTAALPQGVIHADLFRDNALFEGAELSGVIDLYAACNDSLLYDLAICVNDWCIDATGAIDLERGRALVGAYHQKRPLSVVERDAWPMMLRRAALRFWLSRLRDKFFPRPGHLTRVLDPDHFLTILQRRIDHPESLAGLDCQAVT